MASLVHWFEVPISDLERARVFYHGVFGYEMLLQEMGPLKMAWFLMEQNQTYATGRLVQADSYISSHLGSMVFFSVESIDATLAKVRTLGGTVPNPKSSIGDFEFVAHSQDTEGNRVALHSVS
jgi:hypothetical protein